MKCINFFVDSSYSHLFHMMSLHDIETVSAILFFVTTRYVIIMAQLSLSWDQGTRKKKNEYVCKIEFLFIQLTQKNIYNFPLFNERQRSPKTTNDRIHFSRSRSISKVFLVMTMLECIIFSMVNVKKPPTLIFEVIVAVLGVKFV